VFSIKPGSTTVIAAISFDGQTWTISPDDFKLAPISSGQFSGSIFVFTGPSNGPGWIVGNMLLKNVYLAFMASSALIGFAVLAPGAQISVTSGPGVSDASSGHSRECGIAQRSPAPRFCAISVMSTSLFYLL
jgi:hypothetical protein